jgi:hypothetical protein
MDAVLRWFLGGVVLAGAALPAAAQSTSPAITRQQREVLQALIRAVDNHTSDVQIAERDWPVHLLRASDGSHYVAFSLNQVEVTQSAIVYVRLATRRQGGVAAPERSVVAEWLAGQSPVPVLPRRGIAFGEMPTYGAGSAAARGAATISQNLQLLELERQRAREKREEQERQRKATLEGAEAQRAPWPLFPFEDFDLQASTAVDSAGTVLRRSVTAGPGDYELIVAWSDAKATPKGPLHVARRALSLPPASAADFALSTVIVADAVNVRETAIAPAEQTSHPYSIGGTEVTPARDHVLTSDERLALVVQVINSRGTPAGKPDVEVSFRVFRREGLQEQNIGALAPQQYNELTLPVDFDINKGHPIFAAVAVPLKTFKRGDYRMAVTAHDRIAGAGASTDVGFTVTGTPAALLMEAPPLAPPFDPRREALPAAVPIVLGSIRATEGNDSEAIAAWQTAIDGGAHAVALWPVMIDAALRLGDTARAVDLATRALESAPGDARTTRQLARAHLLASRPDAALQVLDAHLGRAADDLEAQWLALHALYSSHVRGSGPGATPQGRARLLELAERYAAANGPHAALARDWALAAR